MHHRLLRLTIAILTALNVPAVRAQTIAGRISFSKPVAGIAVNSSLNRVYVVAPSFGGISDVLAVIDGQSDKIIATVPLATGAYLPAINPLTNRIYIASCNSYKTPLRCFVAVLDGNDNKLIASIPVTNTPGNGIQGIAVDPITEKVYIANASDNVINVIDGHTDKLAETISINGESPYSIAINPFNRTLYVPLGDDQLDVIDTRSEKIVSTPTVGKSNIFAGVNLNTGEVFVIDTGFRPSDTKDPNTGDFVTQEPAGTASVSVFNHQGELAARIPVGSAPDALDIDPVTNLVFVINESAHTVTVIDGKAHGAAATVGHIEGNHIAVNPQTRKVYIAGRQGVTVIRE